MQPPPGLESRMLHLALDRNAAQPRAAGSVRTPRLAALVAVLPAGALMGGPRIISTLATKKGPNLSACSPRSGRMVITTASGAKDRVTQQTRIGFGEIDVIDFKTGHVLFRHDFSPGEVDAMPISHDGLLAALGTQFRFTVVSLVDGHVVSQAPAATPLGFSWDDRLLVANGAANRGELIDVPTGQVVWIDPTAEVTQGAASEPDG